MAWLLPDCGKGALWACFRISLMGAALGGLYGILHDQVTYTLSEEYFTKLKFEQFAFMNLGWHPRVFVGGIGLMATWWVGLITGWLIARAGIHAHGGLLPLKTFGKLALLLVGVVVTSAILGYGFGWFFYEARQEHWAWVGPLLQVEDVERFARVGYAHNFVYVGGVVGTVICMVWAKRLVKSSSQRQASD